MKLLILLSGLFVISTSADKCGSKKKNDNSRLKARLETKALCMNYTFTLTEGSLDTSLIEASWTDENTGKEYKNAFGIANPCRFPATVNQGDEFYFSIDSSKQEQCAVCMAYYPSPQKKLAIKVLEN